jgi:putative membrane protein
MFPAPVITKNDKQARLLILVFSFVVFTAVVLLSRIKLDVNLGFDVHNFALLNAIINSLVTFCLLAGLVAVRRGNYIWHKRIMLTALILSVIFLVSYICHHLLAGETKFGDLNHDGILSDDEKLEAGSMRMVYFIILITHIPLAGLILPFILFTAYRALVAEWPKHTRLARITWPIWLYVSFTGVLVYLLISPYYS